MKTSFWIAALVSIGGVLPLHAGFIGTVCYGDLSSCASASTVTAVTSGSTTYTYDGQFSGGLLGGTPTMGTFAQMTVDDPGGVPTLPSGLASFANMSFTDTVGTTPQPVYSFNLSLHVINSTISYQVGFYEAKTQFILNVIARDINNVQQWATSNVSFPHVTINAPGTTTMPLTFTTPLGFPNANVAKLDITMSLTSSVWYANNPHITNATHVTAFSDASHTITLDSIEAEDGFGNTLPATFTSSVGANYSGAAAVPEPATGVLIAMGLAGAVAARRWRAAR
jgi:hypothetical protein